MSGNKKDLLLFFDRPTEPCFMQKGEDKAVFELPDHYYPEKYKNVSNQLVSKFGEGSGRSIPVKNIALPDLSLPMKLPYNEQFSLFVPAHRQLAGKLIDIFMNMRDVSDLQSVCSYCQLRINPYMFNYCLSVAILHRPDTKGLNIPTFAETFPDKFVDPKVFRRAREATSVVPDGSRMPIVIPQSYTASDAEPEQRVAYFREDVGINLHHWHWHLVYPFDAADRNIVNKDRRGELFYYMHQQIIARYNMERFCNNLGRVERYSDFRTPIKEGYFPKLDSQVASRTWPPRFAGSTISDLDRPVDVIRADVSQLETWRDRFIEAIEAGAVDLPSGRKLPLDEQTGIDTLGNLMEASVLSRNSAKYGDLHNMGHVFISYAHDPDNRHLEQFGVMGDSATAMRDPVFYRWHANVDEIFNLHKAKLPPYSPAQLDFPSIRVSSVSVEGRGGANTFNTQWEQSMVELSRGLDFQPRGSMPARFTHLQHDEFNYKIEVNNTSGGSMMGTVRIFIAPTGDERGQPFATFEEQRRLMVELDKFSTGLRPGNNVITRSSKDSSVTIPYERTFRSQEARPGDPGSDQAAEFDFCGCGWPHHMLLPKGTTQGYPVVLFAMVTNWNEDRVEQDLVGSCNDAASYCGIRDRKYPDKRAMGFPFDRPNPVRSLNDFLQPNMAVRQCTIRFTDATRVRGQNKIEVNNTSGGSMMGTVRIFIAPTGDERGQPFATFEEQRRLMVELDKFSTGLRPGNNVITRSSKDSSVTIPYERTFRSQEARPGDPGSDQAAEFDFCGCGWPHHMLLPKGTTQGYPVVLFAMVTNWNEDRVEQDLVGSCNDAASYCGIRDRKYPDKRAMGFPFDRPNPVRSLNDFLQPNMAVRQCTIRFTDATRVRGQNK